MLPEQNLSGKNFLVPSTSVLTALEVYHFSKYSPVLVPVGSVNVSIEHAKMWIL